MKLLLDTHALVWWWHDDARLPAKAAEAITASGTEIVVSAVTAWEIANKYRLGKWPEVASMVTGFDALLAESDFSMLPVKASHAVLAGSLPGPHRDPFDRLLAAQALVEACTFVSGDAQFAAFGVPMLWREPVH